jgi:hypothetical protein
VIPNKYVDNDVYVRAVERQDMEGESEGIASVVIVQVKVGKCHWFISGRMR